MDISSLHKLFLESDGISTDSRRNVKNKIYFALKGENFDGGDFVQNVLEAGALFAVTEKSTLMIPGKTWVVDNVLVTLQALSTHHRKFWGKRIIAITGSNGKTTTKELIARVLSMKYKVFATQGNLNNHIGVPLTLLSLTDEEIAVVEMGANHQGEIKELCNICQPDFGLITNIGKAHLEGFGGLEGVKKGKGELFDYLVENKRAAFLRKDDPVLSNMAQERDVMIIPYGKSNDNIAQAVCELCNPSIQGYFSKNKQQFNFQSSLFGAYNFYNIHAAIAIGNYFKVAPERIVNAIESYESVENRSQVIEGASNTVILDAYNANPSSMQFALSDFMQRSTTKNKLVILGDMLELGDDTATEHEHILDLLKDQDYSVILVGEEFSQFTEKEAYPFVFLEKNEDLLEFLESNPVRESLVLLKGSRKISLEKATKYLL